MSTVNTPTSVTPERLHGSIKAPGYFALAFGSVVGSAWIIVLGLWLKTAGPGGAILGVLVGGSVMVLISACYAELAARMPQAGGEVLYVSQVFGPNVAFMIAWFLTIFYIAVCAFEGIALSILFTTLFPTLKGATLYSYLGDSVTTGGLTIGFVGVVVVAVLNYFGVKLAVLFQNIVTYAFIALSLGLIVAAFIWGDFSNTLPLFKSADSTPWYNGAFWIFAGCVNFLSGFQVVCYAIDERHPNTSVRSIVWAMIASIICGTLFYALIVLAASSAVPWQSLLDSDLPAPKAFGALTQSGILSQVVLIAAIISLSKTWNGVMINTTRLMHSQVGMGFLPRIIGKIHPRYGSPHIAILITTFVSIAGVMLGKGAIGPILNTCGISIAIVMIIVLLVLHKKRQTNDVNPVFKVPGGIWVIRFAILMLCIMALTQVYDPWARGNGSIPIEWTLNGAWAILGLVFMFASKWKGAVSVART
jgi:basic amino acid/polyamine antiporter, APA family